MKMLVTGATGFIGSHLAEELARNNHKLVCLARKGSDVRLLKKLNAEIIYGDLLDEGALEKAVSGVDVVYHLAASRKHSEGKEAIYKVNVEGTRNLLKASLGKVRHFVFCSTIFVQSSLAPTAYCESKKEAERLVRAFGERGLQFTIIRPAVVYGERDVNGMLTKICRMVKQGKYFIVGSGKNKISLIYAGDLAKAFALVGANKKAFGKEFAVAGDGIEAGELSHKVATELGKKIPSLKIPILFVKIPALIVENLYDLFGVRKEPFITLHKVELLTKEQVYDYSAIKKLGFENRVGYSEGIKRTVGWFKGVGG